ncbi:MAG TPA: hypothetical protein VK707_08205, partial [Solirubrobacteraceae bacterium]|nr:hypothetical protein [Solirubrobacteraceae bacterium]
TAPAGAGLVAAARERLAALHPSFVRLLVDWAALQPDPRVPPALEAPVDGCARETGPCAGYRGIAGELTAIAAQQRAARAEGRTAYQVVLDVFGTPAWAARAPGGCEPPGGARPFSRPITDAGLSGYRALIRSLLALAARDGVELRWWSPWNEPNNPRFLSPQRASCASGSPSLAIAVYSQLAQAMAGALATDGAGPHRLLLGELASYTTSSPHGTSVAEFVGELPASVICLSEDWAIHAYASYRPASSKGDPVTTLESALDARGACGRDARVWITEAGAGAPRPGRRRPSSAAAEREGCLALGAQLARWAADPRVEAILQYSFREDPAFPVGLLSADLAHVYPTYRLWLAYTQARALGEPPRSPDEPCA